MKKIGFIIIAMPSRGGSAQAATLNVTVSNFEHSHSCASMASGSGYYQGGPAKIANSTAMVMGQALIIASALKL